MDLFNTLEELALASALMEQSSDFESLLVSPIFTIDEKESALNKLSGTLGFSEGTIKFLSFLVKENAAYGLAQVLSKAVAIYSESMGRVKGCLRRSLRLPQSLRTGYARP